MKCSPTVETVGYFLPSLTGLFKTEATSKSVGGHPTVADPQSP
jgi:hypothetical protein